MHFAVLVGGKTGVYTTHEDALATCSDDPYYVIKQFSHAYDADDAVRDFQPSSSSKTLVVIYADGACSSNGKHGAAAGVGVFWGPDDPRNVSRPVRGPSTNNVAELEAIEDALQQIWTQITPCALHPFEYRIVTDSQYCISALTTWYDVWEKRGWKTTTGGPVKNLDLIRRIHDRLELVRDFVKLVHVRGHVGIPGNEAADELAKAGISSRVLCPK